MQLPFELLVGLRYTAAKRRNRFISLISGISIIGIALGVTALITVISVMNGFEHELKTRMLNVISHMTISSYTGGLENWEQVMQQALNGKDIMAAAPYVERETLIKSSRIHGALIRGIEPEQESQVSSIDEQMVTGEMKDLIAGDYNIVLGQGLAYRLGASLGEKITIISPEIRSTPVGVIPVVRQFKVVGIFEAGMQQYDTALAFVHLHDAQKLFRMNNTISGIRLKVSDLFFVNRVKVELEQLLDGFYRIRDWTQEHVNFFRAVAQEKVVMFIILSMIIAVAAINIISTLVMVVTDKQADIAILRTQGASALSITGIFLIQGLLIGTVGTLVGVIGGILLASNIEAAVAFLEKLFGFEALSADVYYISDLPSDLRWSDVLKTALVAFGLSILATIYPSWRAAKVNPAEALRYE